MYMEYLEKYRSIQDDNYYAINCNYAYICDLTGSGKSLCILSLIANNIILEMQ